MNRHGKLAEGQTRLSVQVSTDEKQALQQAAKQDRRSLSNYLSIEVAAIVRRIKGEKTDLPHTTNPNSSRTRPTLKPRSKKPMCYPKRERSDEDLQRLFRVGVAAGIPVSLNGEDGRLIDMYGWPGDSIKHELLGMRWLEYVDVRDTKRLLRWLGFGANGETIKYRGVGPGGYECECALCKLNGEHLRLITGVIRESHVMLPAPACVADDTAPRTP